MSAKQLLGRAGSLRGHDHSRRSSSGGSLWTCPVRRDVGAVIFEARAKVAA